MKKFIKDLKVGEVIKDSFLLKKKEMAKTKEGKPYLRVSFADKTGSVDGMVWDDAEATDKCIQTGMVVYVSAEVDKYRENIQLKVKSVRAASDDEYNAEDIVRTVENGDAIFKNIIGLFESCKSAPVLSLAKRFFGDDELMKRFMRSPGASSWHNAYLGGLMEHTWEVMYIVDKVCVLYPQAHRDVAIMGAFVHDIGKVVEIDPKTFEYTLYGGLIGHLPLGFEILSKKIDEVKDFPDDIALHLKHIILSHHGEYEQQSPILPKTLEATIVYHADDLVSQANAVKEIIAQQSPMQKVWSNFVSIKNRKYLLTKPSSE